MTDDPPNRPLHPSERPTAPPGGSYEPTSGPSVPPDGHAETIPPPPSVATVRVDPYLGKTLDGRYVVEAILGEGGMGVVYRGRHKLIDKRVAIKVLRGEMAQDDEITARFLQEARAASAIGNPHIIDISDFGQLNEGLTYFVMEHLDGLNLTNIIAQIRPFPVARLCRIAIQVAEGLAAAHDANIVHRDLKPDNIMLIQHGNQRDFVKILDFGIAKVGGAANRKTRAGSVFGTPHYMSPEQAAGAVVDHRTDIYALGVILYEMASGQVPFDADNFMGILTQHMYKAPTPLRTVAAALNLPPGLDAIVLKCLAKKPEGRFQTMGELVADLRKLESGLEPESLRDMPSVSGMHAAVPDYFSDAVAPTSASTGKIASNRSPARALLAHPRLASYVALGTVMAAVAGAVLSLAYGNNEPVSAVVSPPKQELAATPPAPSPAPKPAPAPSPPSESPVEPKDEVLVSVVPVDATITREGRDLGTAPVAVRLGRSEIATLIVSHAGYKPEVVSLRAADGKRVVTLRPLLEPDREPARAQQVSKGRTAEPSRPPSAKPKVSDDVGDPFTAHAR